MQEETPTKAEAAKPEGNPIEGDHRAAMTRTGDGLCEIRKWAQQTLPHWEL
jgi:hypothetical protein